MSRESVSIQPTEEDPLISREKQKCDTWVTLFGEVLLGTDKTVLPRKYLQHCDEILDLEVRPDDVWVISNPRSGTTWTEELVWLLCQNLDYETARSTALHKRFKFLEFFMFPGTEGALKDFGNVDALKACPSPRFIKTHLHLDLLPKQLHTVKPKIIFVYRNPKDVVISRYHFSTLPIIAGYRGSFEDFAEIFLGEKYLYAPFWNKVLSFWRMRDQKHILFLTYEEMKQDLILAIHKVASHLGSNLTDDEAKKLAEHLDYDTMKKNDALNMLQHETHTNPNSAFIRVGQCQQWKTKMGSDLIRRFDDWSRKQIEGTDFPVHWAC